MKLTLEQSEKLLSDGYDEFCDFISMDDDAASVLAAYVGTLSFPDLLKISESLEI